MIADVTIMVMYGQVLVAAVGSEPVTLSWSDAEVAQGFAWTPTLVGFGVPDHDGLCRVCVDRGEQAALAPDVLWAVRVPFEVPSSGVEFGTVLDMRPVPIAPGRYGVVFQASPGTGVETEASAFELRLTFVAPGEPDFAILRQGTELRTATVLSPAALPTERASGVARRPRQDQP